MSELIKSNDIEFIKKEMVRYEDKYSAIIPALYKIQERHGWVSEDSVDELSKVMDIPSADILEVRNFYTMFNQKPVGKLHVQVCTNVSCAMNGGRELADHICKKYSVKKGEVSSDGHVTVNQVECLGSCDTAPMMQINDRYWENLTHESAVEIIEKLRS